MRKTGALLGIAVSLMLALHVTSQAQPRTGDAIRLVGTWRLAQATGPADRGRGPNSRGLMYLDSTGHIAVQVMPDRPRAKFASTEPTPEEAKAALTGYSAYFGTYRVDEVARTLIQHRLGSINPGEVGGDFTRRYEFAGDDRLVLTPLEGPGRTLTWERGK